MHGVGKLQTIHGAGHLNVGKKQGYVRATFENRKRFIGVDGFDRREPCILNDIDRAHAKHHLIFHNKDVRSRPDWGS